MDGIQFTLMGPESLTSGMVDLLRESQVVREMGPELIQRDTEFLTSLGGRGSRETVENVTGYLEGEERPGSAKYMGVFYDAVVLDAELTMIETGTFDLEALEAAGLPVLVDAELTTLEMVRAGQAVLPSEVRGELLGSLNGLAYRIDRHVGATIRRASDHYAGELAPQKATVAASVKKLLGVKPPPYEIPCQLDEAEVAELAEMSDLGFLSEGEAQRAFRDKVERMMKRRPRIVGLESTASLSKFIKDVVTEKLGGARDGPVEVGPLRRFKETMKGPGMDELQIHSGFAEVIEESVGRELSLESE